MGNHLCVILYLLHLGVTAPLLAVRSSQRGLSPCTPDLKPQPKSLQGIFPAWGVVCGTAGGTAAWIPRSVAIPPPLTASIRITVRLLLPCLQRVFCVCPAARAGVCCLLFLFPRELESPRSLVFRCALSVHVNSLAACKCFVLLLHSPALHLIP